MTTAGGSTDKHSQRIHPSPPGRSHLFVKLPLLLLGRLLHGLVDLVADHRVAEGPGRAPGGGWIKQGGGESGCWLLAAVQKEQQRRKRGRQQGMMDMKSDPRT
jgi:hypothetical protein